MSVHISSLSANKGITLKRSTALPEFVLLMETLSFEEAETRKVLNGEDVTLMGRTLIKFKASIEGKLKSLIPKASNSERGISYEIFGEKIKLNTKAHESDSNIRFLYSLMKMVDEAIINHDCIYLLNKDRLKRPDNTGVMLSVIRDHNGTMKVEEVLSIINKNRTKIENAGEQLDIRQLQLAIDDFENLALVKRSGDVVTITSKGRALILF